MSFINVTPDIISQAAGDLESIGSNLTAANAAAAMPTTGLLPAGADEVSIAITQLLGIHAQDYQALSNLATNFHTQFVDLLNNGASQYLIAEAANAEQALASAGASVGNAVQGAAGFSPGISLPDASPFPLLSAFSLPSGLPQFTGLLSAPACLQGLESSAVNAFAPLSQTLGSWAAPAAAVSPLPAATGGSGAYADLIARTSANWSAIQADFASQTVPAVLAAATNPFGVPQAILGALEARNPLALLGIPGQIATASAELTKQLNVPLSMSSFIVQGGTAELTVDFGLPQQLAYDALGAPITGAIAAGQSMGTILDAFNSGNMGAAATALFGAPANIADGFLNGAETISLDLQLPQGMGQATAQIPVSGLLGPLQPLTASVTVPGLPFVNTFTVTGPQVGGLVPGVNSAVQQVATTLA